MTHSVLLACDSCAERFSCLNLAATTFILKSQFAIAWLYLRLRGKNLDMQLYWPGIPLPLPQLSGFRDYSMCHHTWLGELLLMAAQPSAGVVSRVSSFLGPTSWPLVPTFAIDKDSCCCLLPGSYSILTLYNPSMLCYDLL